MKRAVRACRSKYTSFSPCLHLASRARSAPARARRHARAAPRICGSPVACDQGFLFLMFYVRNSGVGRDHHRPRCHGKDTAVGHPLPFYRLDGCVHQAWHYFGSVKPWRFGRSAGCILSQSYRLATRPAARESVRSHVRQVVIQPAAARAAATVLSGSAPTCGVTAVRSGRRSGRPER